MPPRPHGGLPLLPASPDVSASSATQSRARPARRRRSRRSSKPYTSASPGCAVDFATCDDAPPPYPHGPARDRAKSACPRAEACRLCRHPGQRMDIAMKPVDDVRQISALTYGFIASKALFAALDLDLFTKIAGGADDPLRSRHRHRHRAQSPAHPAHGAEDGRPGEREPTGRSSMRRRSRPTSSPARRATSATTSGSSMAASSTKACAISRSRCAARGSSPTRASTRASSIPKAASAARPSAARSMPARSALPVSWRGGSTSRAPRSSSMSAAAAAPTRSPS